jgi:hypothetical protein
MLNVLVGVMDQDATDDTVKPCCHCAHTQVDCLEMDPYMTELFGRGNREGLLHWLRDGTLVINNVHKVWHRRLVRCASVNSVGVTSDGWPAWLLTCLLGASMMMLVLLAYLQAMRSQLHVPAVPCRLRPSCCLS